MHIQVRQEKPEDYRRVEEVAREAFWNLYTPGCSEHMVMHHMRKHQDFIPELTSVVEVDGEIVGSIFYSHSKVVAADGTEHKTISFGPVSILPSMHRKGLGRAMITHTIALAKEMGYTAILTLGYDYHYKPYGFEGGKKYGISMPDGKYYKGLLVLPLYEGALDGVSGHAIFSESLEPVEDELEAFDKSFPYKEKKVEPSQAVYEKAVVELEE